MNSLEFNHFFFCNCTSIFRNHDFVCFGIKGVASDYLRPHNVHVHVHSRKHKLFVPCHKLWIFDQSQVSIQNAIEQTIERTQPVFSPSFVRRKKMRQTAIAMCDCARCIVRVSSFWHGISTAILRREKEYLFY